MSGLESRKGLWGALRGLLSGPVRRDEDLLAALLEDWREERRRALRFREQAVRAHDEELRRSLEHLAQREETHAEALAAAIRQRGGTMDGTLAAEPPAGAHIHMLVSDFEEVDRALGRYEAQRDRFQGTEVEGLLGRLRAEEEEHLQLLKDLYARFT